MTSSMFFSWLRSGLRKLTVRGWKPINECRQEAKIPYVGDNKRMKWLYVCNECKEAFPDKEISVHHIKPVGSLLSFEDLPQFCKNLFCEKEGLKVLCTSCHTKEHEKLKINKEK